MEAWASKIPNAQFLCVCVESKQVAIAFHRMFQFQNVVNAFIPSREYMPVGYGQLGCSGFIVSDTNGCFVSRKTQAFLDYGEAAFEHVESLLAAMIPPTVEQELEGPEKKTSETVACTKVPEQDLKKRVEPPASVGVDAMDDEHKECTDAFNLVIQDTSSKNLQILFDTLKSHFDHEEALITKYIDNSTSFSSLNSHKKDHGRILKIAADELDRVNGCGLGGK